MSDWIEVEKERPPAFVPVLRGSKGGSIHWVKIVVYEGCDPSVHEPEEWRTPNGETVSAPKLWAPIPHPPPKDSE